MPANTVHVIANFEDEPGQIRHNVISVGLGQLDNDGDLIAQIFYGNGNEPALKTGDLMPGRLTSVLIDYDFPFASKINEVHLVDVRFNTTCGANNTEPMLVFPVDTSYQMRVDISYEDINGVEKDTSFLFNIEMKRFRRNPTYTALKNMLGGHELTTSSFTFRFPIFMMWESREDENELGSVISMSPTNADSENSQIIILNGSLSGLLRYANGSEYLISTIGSTGLTNNNSFVNYRIINTATFTSETIMQHTKDQTGWNEPLKIIQYGDGVWLRRSLNNSNFDAISLRYKMREYIENYFESRSNSI